MVYTPPTKVMFREMVSRDLRDPDNAVFGPAEVDDLVNFGIVEVSRIYPVPLIEAVDVVLTDPGDDASPVSRLYQLASREIYRIEVWRNGVFREQVPSQVDYSNSGWDFFGNTLVMPTWVALDPSRDVINVYGYQDRETLHDESDVAEVDPEAEMGVRLYATLTGYQRLQNDRAQFQQWLAIPGNNDISATQLDGITNTYLAQWNRHRNHMRTLRR